MKKQNSRQKCTVSLLLIWLILLNNLPVRAQDLIQVSDITGGSSVFVFRARKPAAARNFNSVPRKRSVAQRRETVKRVTKQYVTVAKVAPRRVRTKEVDPGNVPAGTNSMPPAKAAVIFAGVGEYYINKDDADNALNFFREAVGLDQKNTNAQNGLSDALALKGNQLLVAEKNDSARAFFTEAVKINPKNAAAVYGLGEVSDELDKPDEAVANYEKALSLDKSLTEIYVPLGILYYQKGEIAKADTLLTKAVAAAPNDAETQYFVGLVRYTQNRNADALAALETSIKTDPNNAEAHYYKGKTLLRLNRQSDALTEFKEAIRLKPAYYEANFDAGAANYELKNYADAVVNYKEAVRLKNDDAQAYANLGDADRQVNNFNDAENSYDLALVFNERGKKEFSNDDIAGIYSNIAYVLGSQCAINRRTNKACKTAKAIASLEKAVELSPNPSDYANLGWIYYNTGKLDIASGHPEDGKLKIEKSIAASQKSVDANPSFVEAPLLNLGTALIDTGDYKRAIDALERVTAKRSDWIFAYYALGAAYTKNGNFSKAVEPFKKAVAIDPNYVAALVGLGNAQYRSGNGKECEKIIAKLKTLSPVDAKRLEIVMMNGNKK